MKNSLAATEASRTNLPGVTVLPYEVYAIRRPRRHPGRIGDDPIQQPPAPRDGGFVDSFGERGGPIATESFTIVSQETLPPRRQRCGIDAD